MTESQTDKPHPKKRRRGFGRLEIDEVFLLVLTALSVVGMAVTDAAPDLGLWFWLILAPVYCGASLYIQWSRGRDSTLGWSSILRSQILHWLGLLLAIQIGYLLLYMGRLNYENTGYVVALMLALTTYLSGGAPWPLADFLSWRLSGRIRNSGGLAGAIRMAFLDHRRPGDRGLQFLCQEPGCRQAPGVVSRAP